MEEQKILNQLKKLIISIDSLITSIDIHIKNKDYVKIVSEAKRGETELMKFKMLLAGLKKVNLNDENKKEIVDIVLPLQKKVKKLSIISDTNALFFGSFLNILSSLLSSNYNEKGKMAVHLNNTRISHSI